MEGLYIYSLMWWNKSNKYLANWSPTD